MNPDQQQQINNNNHHQHRERSIPITTQGGGGVTTTHFPLSSSSTHPATSSSPFSNSPGRSGAGGNLFNQLHQFRNNQHADEMFSDRNHFPSFGYPSMSSASRNVGDFFSHGHRDGGDESESESHQPRVYNIPIQVETPEGVVPLSRSNSHSPGSSQIRNNSFHAAPVHGGGPIPERVGGETFSRQRPGPSPTPPPKPRFTPSYKPDPQGYNMHQQPYHQEAQQQQQQHQQRVHNIPVQIERGSKPRDVSNDSKQNVPGSDQRSSIDPNVGRDSPRPESQSSVGGGPHVINIPVNNERVHQSENESHQQSQSAPNQSKFTSETPKGPIDPLTQVQGIKDEASRLESEVNDFDGESQKRYRFLDEMLTRCMLKLDNIDSGGRDDVRSARKSTLSYVDRVIASLESKFNKRNENQGQEEAPQHVESNVQQSPEIGSSMEVESGEADSTEQQQEPADDHPNTESCEPDSCKQQSSEVESQMEVASSSNSDQPKETSNNQTEDEQEDDGNDDEAINEEEDPSGVDGSKQGKRSSLKKWIKKKVQRSRPSK